MAWHCKEIHELCNVNNLSYPEPYLKALDWMEWKAKYHAQQAQRVWENFKSAHPRGWEVGGSNQEWWDTFDASAAETEAVVQSLYSQADVIAQVINQIMLGGSLCEEKVTFSKMLEELEKSHRSASNVTTRIRAFRNTREFKYVRAFCNTMKHRRLIDAEWRAEGGEGTRNEEGVRFRAFSYKGSNWPITWASDINDHYRKTLRKCLREIGTAIIDRLRANP